MAHSLVDDRNAGPRWHLAPDLAALWPGGWPVAEWLASGAARIVKKGPQRTVFRVDLPGLAIYLKQHHLPDRLTRLRQSLRAPKAKRECDRLAELVRRGVPAPEPLGWGVWPQWPGESVVVTRAIDDVVSLNRLFVDGRLDSRSRQALAEALGRFLATLHAAGVDHRDLHSGNIVARPRALPLLPRYSGGEGWGEGAQDPSPRRHAASGLEHPLTPNPSPPEYRGRGEKSAGFDHRDLHSGNIVARPRALPPRPRYSGGEGWGQGAQDPSPRRHAASGLEHPLTPNPSPPEYRGRGEKSAGFDLFLVDLDAVRLRAPLDRERSLANLALFGAGCFQATERSDRLRFLRAYVDARGWFDVRRDLAGGRELFDLARIVERAAWTYNLSFWAHRDRRCLVANRYYRSIRQDAYTGMAVRGVDDDWLARFANDPEALLREPGVKILKHSKTSTVAEITALVDGAPRTAILKKIGVTRWSDPWAALVRPTPIQRSWVSGHGLLERNLPTPRPLVMLHRRRNGLLHEGYLVTEKLDDVQELDSYVAGLGELPAAERLRRLRRQIDRVARALQALHDRQVSHRDMKAANLLVTSLAVEETLAPRPICVSPFPVAATTLWFIDLVGVTRHARLGKRRRVQNLARLNASFLTSKIVTRTDRLRFLRVYLAWGVHGKGEWKPLWRAIAAATAAKVERNKKSGRTLG